MHNDRSPSEVLAYARENGAKLVDLKFIDWPGMWNHCTYPMHELDESTFEDGLGFDGSSIRGWQSIDASDMLMIPDPKTAMINHPLDVVYGPDEKLYFADAKNNVIRVVDLAKNTINTIAGNGVYDDSGQGIGDGGPATKAPLGEPRGIAFDYDGNLIIADTYNNLFRKVNLNLSSP